MVLMWRYIKVHRNHIQQCLHRYCSTNIMKNPLPIALIQLVVGTDRTANLENAQCKIREAKEKGAQVVILPECFNSPYGVKFFKEYAESIPGGPSCQMLSQSAKEHEIYLIGGTIPEEHQSNLYNTSTVWNPAGELIAKYRKMHLFDIDVPGIRFKESEALSAGNELATFSIGNSIKVGIGICYDLRFEELAKLYRLQGCHILVYPAAFTMTTGPQHFELLQRSRALDNQVFVCGISPATGKQGYIAWGHSQVTDPWGKVIAQAGHEPEVLVCDIDISECAKVREQIPIHSQRRTDVYQTQLLKSNNLCG